MWYHLNVESKKYNKWEYNKEANTQITENKLVAISGEGGAVQWWGMRGTKYLM